MLSSQTNVKNFESYDLIEVNLNNLHFMVDYGVCWAEKIEFFIQCVSNSLF